MFTRQSHLDEFQQITIHHQFDGGGLDRIRQIPCVCNVADADEVHDFSDACLKFISDMLMEENLDDQPTTLQDYQALQATEKSLYDVLGETYPPSSDHCATSYGSCDDDFNKSSISSSYESGCFIPCQDAADGKLVFGRCEFPVCHTQESEHGYLQSESVAVLGKTSHLSNELRMSRIRPREDSDFDEIRSSKLLAAYDGCYVQLKQYDDILLHKEEEEDVLRNVGSSQNEAYKNLVCNGSIKLPKGRANRGNQKIGKEAAVDLKALLTNCARAVASFELTSMTDLLNQIRRNSSPYGNSIQRVAHYFATGLEARIAGPGGQQFGDLVNSHVPISDTLKAYRSYYSRVPVNRISFFLANQTIAKLAENARRLHIIDFGILYGFQWPSLIQQLSEAANGPPLLRVTGIDLPQNGFQPAEMLEETGRRLAGYCERFNVPFEYRAMAQKWETIDPEDLRIERDEVVIVNCLYRSTTLLDETMDVKCPRDAFLRLVWKLKPDLFIHAVVNGSCGAPFFLTRFREAMFHYFSVFDMLESTMPCEDYERLLFEKELHGKEILNVIACESVERAYRPETYKQWQIRSLRARFKQLSFDWKLVNQAKGIVKADYHKDFVVDEDGQWILQGWKGRILFAISCWEPVQTSSSCAL
ncbi:Scarecrow-like protein [Drosera capensis]